MEKAWDWTQDDRIANVLPLHHVHGIMNVLNTSLWVGAHCTLLPKYDTRELWSILLGEHPEIDITLFMGVPTIYSKLIHVYDHDKMAERSAEIKKKLGRLRLMVSGSSALPSPAFYRWE